MPRYQSRGRLDDSWFHQRIQWVWSWKCRWWIQIRWIYKDGKSEHDPCCPECKWQKYRTLKNQWIWNLLKFLCLKFKRENNYHFYWKFHIFFWILLWANFAKMINFNENPVENFLYNYAFEAQKEEIRKLRKLIDEFKEKEHDLRMKKFTSLNFSLKS